MSKFFQSKTYTEIDDVNYSYNTTWSSNRIAVEIQNLKPKLKLGELSDVNTNNVDDKYTITYSKALNTWVATPISDIIGKVVDTVNSGCVVRQVTKLGVTGSPSVPQIFSIPYITTDFKIPRVNMLKFKGLGNDLVTTEGQFSASEQSDFVNNNFITFDNSGKARLKTDYKQQMIYEDDLLDDKIWNIDVNKTLFKEILDMNIDDDIYPSMIYKAIPQDQILIQQKDYDLSSVSKVKAFELGAKGKNIRVLCSADAGKTWRYFDGNTFQSVPQLDVANITQYGNTIDEFNAIRDRWNYITNNKMIRFAYLLSMNSISDEEYVDYINLRYTGSGVWVQAKDVEYDVEITNTELKIYCYVTGDIKINYESNNQTEGGDDDTVSTQYSGTTSSGGVITTTVPNEKIYFFDPHDLSSRVPIKNLYLESITPFTFSFNDELSTHTLEGSGTAIEVDGFTINYLVIKEVGAQLKFEALI